MYKTQHTAQAPTVSVHACKTQREREYRTDSTAQLAGVRLGLLVVVVGTCLRPGRLGGKERGGTGGGR